MKNNNYLKSLGFKPFVLAILAMLTLVVNGQYCKPIDNYPITGGYAGFGVPSGNVFHNGSDFSATVGTNVYAIRDGYVIYSKEAQGFGSLNPDSNGGVIIIKHQDNSGNDFYTVYGHLYRNLQNNTSGQPGEYVTQGQIIGTIRPFYNNGNFLPHLHFGIRTSNFPTSGWGYSSSLSDWHDPLPYLNTYCAPMMGCNINSITLISPPDGSVHYKLNNIQFTWSNFPGAAYYRIWVDNNSGFGSPEIGYNNGSSPNWINNGIVITNSFSLTLPMQSLLPQNLYFWKVQALDANQNPISPWSIVWSFSLLDIVSNPPNLQSPNDNTTFIKGSSIPFTWTGVTNGIYYEVWIDNNSGFGSPEIGYNNGSSPNWINNGIVSINCFTLTPIMQNLLPQNVYYWKVRALDANQNPISDWSSTWSFILLDQVTGKDEITDGMFSISPNPVNNMLTIYGEKPAAGDILVTLINNVGQLKTISRFTSFNPNTEYHINMSELPKGVYYLNINSGNTNHYFEVIKI